MDLNSVINDYSHQPSVTIVYVYRQLLESSMVDANVLVDKHNPTPVLIRACEDGSHDFVKVLLEHGAIVSYKYL